MLAYTDASFDDARKEAVVSMLFLANDMFMGMYVERISASTSSEAELKGIILAIEWVEDNYPESKVIKIKTDNESNVQLYERYKNNPKFLELGVKSQELWSKLIKLSERYEIHLAHVNGHLSDKNPNNVCDVLARRYLSMRGDKSA